jgi:LysM repeat protein
MRPLRVTPRQRVPRALRLLRLFVALAFVFLAVWAGDQVAQAVSDKAPAGVVHVVEQGETVWQIVVAQYGGRERDVRQLVDQVLAANDLADAQLSVGQELVLPPVSE